MKNILQKIGLFCSIVFYSIAVYYAYLAWGKKAGDDAGIIEIIDAAVFMLLGFCIMLVFVAIDAFFNNKAKDNILKSWWVISIFTLLILVVFGLLV